MYKFHSNVFQEDSTQWCYVKIKTQEELNSEKEEQWMFIGIFGVTILISGILIVSAF